LFFFSNQTLGPPLAIRIAAFHPLSDFDFWHVASRQKEEEKKNEWSGPLTDDDPDASEIEETSAGNRWRFCFVFGISIDPRSEILLNRGKFSLKHKKKS